jgi:hypothetical protein
MKDINKVRVKFKLYFRKEPFEKIIKFDAIKTYEDYLNLTYLEIFNRLKEFIPLHEELKDLANSELRGFQLIEDMEDGGKRTYNFDKDLV